MNEKCLRLLEEYQISHYFNHLPLDDAEFGTNGSLAKELGLKVLKRVNDERGFNDVYLTGEKILYTVEFAKLYDLNLVVGSHTFTELLGVKSMLENLNLV